MLLLVLGLFCGGGLLPVVVPPLEGPVLAPPHPTAATIRSRVIRAASRMMSSERKKRISLSNHAVHAFVPALAVLSAAPRAGAARRSLSPEPGGRRRSPVRRRSPSHGGVSPADRSPRLRRSAPARDSESG